MLWFVCLLLGIMAAYLVAGVPVLRAVERWRWGANRLTLVEACAAWLLANAGALASVVAFSRLLPYWWEIVRNGLPAVLVFGLGLFLTLGILMGLCLRRRFRRLDACKATAAATLYFLIFGMTVFELYEVWGQRQLYQGAVSARSPMELRQRTLAELSEGLDLDFPDRAELVWAFGKGPFDAPWCIFVTIELFHGDLPAFIEQIGVNGMRRLPNSPVRLREDAKLYELFGLPWGPKKWWRPQSAKHFEVWTGSQPGSPLDILIDLDNVRTARLYIVYSLI